MALPFGTARSAGALHDYWEHICNWLIGMKPQAEPHKLGTNPSSSSTWHGGFPGSPHWLKSCSLSEYPWSSPVPPMPGPGMDGPVVPPFSAALDTTERYQEWYYHVPLFFLSACPIKEDSKYFVFKFDLNWNHLVIQFHISVLLKVFFWSQKNWPVKAPIYLKQSSFLFFV